MTVRLIAAIAFADLLTHVGEIYSAVNIGLPNGTPHCTAVSIFRSFSRTFYCFTNIAICFHLYRGLVLLKKSTWKYEVYTWIVTLAMVILFTSVYYSLGIFTGKLRKSACNPGADNKTMNRIYFLFVGIIDLITILVGIFTTIVGRQSLNKWINSYADNRNRRLDDQNKFKSDRKKMASRSFLYPLATCVTLPFEALLLILNSFGIMVLQISIPKTITVGLSGLLTGLAFAFDPASHKAFYSAYTQIREKMNGCKPFKDDMTNYADNIPLSEKNI
ncbi:hypothetical protein CONCODRAFT_2540 [Conidiobolus coronatus NRRL 28638]|uniref:G-protein coupled receptors family 1 profile domain-containing protein n=1 Tax=Conidiobolus coronatus (strain ATCC 28846 / CBS 209.66 / NRRL 28638) TaxID=796925 RepID=A0A137PH52_CONC2|nr:hypothetical protein CONCODRAFT_2540 [Conidiobolus coronatus NRRL 28638]|eukprot:KXN74336.1 hypothetical protein CONCODRAFT_2540 [Conidiobolus coronatus NRRL 28638]